MTTIIEASENSAIINVSLDQLKKLGLEIGDEVEFFNDNSGEIVLRRAQNERTKKILDVTRKIIERRRPALIELSKGHE